MLDLCLRCVDDGWVALASAVEEAEKNRWLESMTRDLPNFLDKLHPVPRAPLELFVPKRASGLFPTEKLSQQRILSTNSLYLRGQRSRLGPITESVLGMRRRWQARVSRTNARTKTVTPEGAQRLSGIASSS